MSSPRRRSRTSPPDPPNELPGVLAGYMSATRLDYVFLRHIKTLCTYIERVVTDWLCKRVVIKC